MIKKLFEDVSKTNMVLKHLLGKYNRRHDQSIVISKMDCFFANSIKIFGVEIGSDVMRR